MLIAIEGCVGVGKTTVAQGLCAYRNSGLLLENFEANPFLHNFYQDPVGTAIETEFSFLLLHYNQLKNSFASNCQAEVFADFHLGKDLLYADLNLADDRAKRLFRELYALCCEQTPRPGLLIYLSATTDLLIERIVARKREFEIHVDPQYFASVNTAYDQYFEAYDGKKLRIPMSEWDFVEDPSLFKRLSTIIDGEIQPK